MLMQSQTARPGPMIRCIRRGNCGLRRRQALRKSEVEGGIRKAVTVWVSYSFKLADRIQNTNQTRSETGAVLRIIDHLIFFGNTDLNLGASKAVHQCD